MNFLAAEATLLKKGFYSFNSVKRLETINQQLQDFNLKLTWSGVFRADFGARRFCERKHLAKG